MVCHGPREPRLLHFLSSTPEFLLPANFNIACITCQNRTAQQNTQQWLSFPSIYYTLKWHFLTMTPSIIWSLVNIACIYRGNLCILPEADQRHAARAGEELQRRGKPWHLHQYCTFFPEVGFLQRMRYLASSRLHQYSVSYKVKVTFISISFL